MCAEMKNVFAIKMKNAEDVNGTLNWNRLSLIIKKLNNSKFDLPKEATRSPGS